MHVRRGRLLPLAAVLAALPLAGRVLSRRRHRAVDRRAVGLSALLPRVSFGFPLSPLFFSGFFGVFVCLLFFVFCFFFESGSFFLSLFFFHIFHISLKTRHTAKRVNIVGP